MLRPIPGRQCFVDLPNTYERAGVILRTPKEAIRLFQLPQLSNHSCNRISFNHSWRPIPETKRPVVRLLEARTLDHTDAKDVENLPEYVVYVFGPITLQPRFLTRLRTELQ